MKNIPIGIVFKESKVLLVQRRFPPLVWSPPGGFPDEGEKLITAVEREVFEESGVRCKAIAQVDKIIVEEFDSELTVFACRYFSGELRCSYESKDIGWFEIDNLPEPLSPDKNVFIKAEEIIKQ